MKKYKCFLSGLEEEEQWINKVQKEGYSLVGVSQWLPLYRFEKVTQDPKLIRIDFKDYMSASKYQDYITLFEDSGWKHLSGSRFGGLQYFQQQTMNSDTDIFSDEESRKQMLKAFYNSTLFSGFCSFIVIYANYSSHSINHWYLNSDIWQISWQASLVLLPLVILFLGVPILLMMMTLYYLIKAWNLKTKV
ncbi:DUF2812 domain-containing protein [Streptococcus castoreus]|uniref:DUF2812 domain-containing protein n=1 Tax=Streptococcus castoreus TaxID=254786 RepID=UPI00041FBAA6|nr:DUF2812 domain-containing protein [Streptococcus castoreus]